MNLIATLIPLLLLAAWPGCETEEPNTTLTDQNSTAAVLHWEGELAVDGCGFFIEINDLRYKPINESIIPERFKQEQQIPVQINYRLHQPIPYACGLQAHEFTAIELVAISEKQE